MNPPQHYKTAPEDRISLGQRLIYGLGGLINNLLAAASGGMMIVLNLGLGMDPALVGLLGALPRFTDALTDPIMGYISDNTKSRWGRRRPYIFVGAISAGITPTTSSAPNLRNMRRKRAGKQPRWCIGRTGGTVATTLT